MKLLKADFHGAIITVSQSRCPSYVGQTGILLQEMKTCFRIVTKADKVKSKTIVELYALHGDYCLFFSVVFFSISY